MYELIPASYSRGRRCDKCRGATTHVFLGLRYKSWQKRCRWCAERMVSEGKTRFAPVAKENGR